MATCAFAQVSGVPVRQGSGPLSDMSRSVSEGSRPVHEPGGSVRELSRDSLSDGSVRGSSTGSVRSGPVSDISVGAVHDRPAPNAFYGGVQMDTEPAYPVAPATELEELQDSISEVEPLPAEDDEETPVETGESPAAEIPPEAPLEPQDPQDGSTQQ